MSDIAVREPAVAGLFYPAEAEALGAEVDALLAAAPGGQPARALLAPHAGYVYSGATAAAGYALWLGLQPRTVYLLGPPHRVPVGGVGLATGQAFRTPLGRVPVDQDATARLLACGPPFHAAAAAHGPEHDLEVQLPFLQRLFAHLAIVAMLADRVDPAVVAAALAPFVSTPEALLVVTSDLSHYLPAEAARRSDRAFLDDLLAGDVAAVAAGNACGASAAAVLCALAGRLGWSPALLDYRHSGHASGDHSSVVGYAAVAYR